MKSKTIKKVIEKKFNDYLQSIKDEQVREIVKNNSIITGGCIASMLLKESVNDFDLYLSNKEAVIAVADYYVKEYLKTNPELNITVVDVDKLVPDSPDGNYYAARGFSQQGRVGVFCSSLLMAESDDSALLTPIEKDIITDILDEEGSRDITQKEESGEKYRPLFISPNAISLSNRVQIIMRFYGEASDIHKNFDFVHCTNYWDSKSRKLVLKQSALEAILAKELIYVGSLYPLTSIIRTRKFIKRQWSVNAGTYLKIMWQISKLDLGNIAVLEDQLIGVDVGYFMALISALKASEKAAKEGGKEFNMDYNYIAEIIDRIFNE